MSVLHAALLLYCPAPFISVKDRRSSDKFVTPRNMAAMMKAYGRTALAVKRPTNCILPMVSRSLGKGFAASQNLNASSARIDEGQWSLQAPPPPRSATALQPAKRGRIQACRAVQFNDELQALLASALERSSCEVSAC